MYKTFETTAIIMELACTVILNRILDVIIGYRVMRSIFDQLLIATLRFF